MIFLNSLLKLIHFNMPINILFIVGLPGSGKSVLAKKINNDNGGKYHIIDDPKKFDIDIQPYLDRDLIITDPSLCFPQNRESAIKYFKDKVPDAKIDWIFFENDPDACLLNARIRNRALITCLKPTKDVESFIKNLNSFYTIPEGSNVVSVYRRPVED